MINYSPRNRRKLTLVIREQLAMRLIKLAFKIDPLFSSVMIRTAVHNGEAAAARTTTTPA